MIRVNLLPVREILRKRDLKRFIVHAALGGAITIVLMIGSYWFYDRELTQMQTKVADMKKERDQLSEQTKQLLSLKQEEIRLKNQVEQNRKLVEKKESIALLLEAVSLAIPDEVWLEKLEKQPNKSFRLDGKSKDNKSVMTFVEQLRNIKANFTERKPFMENGAGQQEPFLENVKLAKLEAAPAANESAESDITFSIEGTIR
ncbi:MAG: PilN domain-containing protein [Desulfomonilaceae bacterium]